MVSAAERAAKPQARSKRAKHCYSTAHAHIEIASFSLGCAVRFASPTVFSVWGGFERLKTVFRRHSIGD